MITSKEKTLLATLTPFISHVKDAISLRLDVDNTLTLANKLIVFCNDNTIQNTKSSMFRAVFDLIPHLISVLECYKAEQVIDDEPSRITMQTMLDIIDADLLAFTTNSVLDSYFSQRDNVLTQLSNTLFDAVKMNVSYCEDEIRVNDDIEKELNFLYSKIESPVEKLTTKPIHRKKNKPSTPITKSIKSKFEPTTKVKSQLLDHMLSYSEELVQIRNSLADYAEKSADQCLIELANKLKSASDNLLNDLLKTRMRPIGIALQKYRRTVRDLSHQLDKNVELEIIGENIELDSNVIDAITEPLTHLVRNAVDHGFESAEERTKQGKSIVGRLLIHAYNESGKVVISISDDGKGINTENLVKKAIASGILTKKYAETMSEKHKLELIFHAGLSTSDHVSTVSGRGVGMDAVKRRVEEIKGSIDIHSTKGMGTEIAMIFPLTMATLKVALFEINNATYAIPSVDITSIVGLNKSDPDTYVRFDMGNALLHKFNKVIPLLDPREYLCSLAKDYPIKTAYQRGEQITVVVFRYLGKEWGLCVDVVKAFLDIVIKPLDNQMNSQNIFSGAAVLGDGELALVINLKKIVQFSQHNQQLNNASP